jgi:nucleoid DNA-binding protein
VSPGAFHFFAANAVYGFGRARVRRHAGRDGGHRGGAAELVRKRFDLEGDTIMAAKKAAAAGGAKKSLSKSGFISAVAEAVGEELSKKQVKQVIEAISAVGYRELKKNGIFTLPGFAKFRVVKKPATKARQGINPFTKQPMTYAAKPASKSVRARPIKAIKDALL